MVRSPTLSVKRRPSLLLLEALLVLEEEDGVSFLTLHSKGISAWQNSAKSRTDPSGFGKRPRPDGVALDASDERRQGRTIESGARRLAEEIVGTFYLRLETGADRTLIDQ